MKARGVIFGAWVGLYVLDAGAFTIQPLDSDCLAQLVTTFPSSSLQGGCQPYTMFHYTQGTEGEFTEQVSCTFSNLTTSFVFKADEQIVVDVRGLSDRVISQADLREDSAWKFESCQGVIDFLDRIRETPARVPAISQKGEFYSRESILLVTSQSRCEEAERAQLNRWLNTLRSEGRFDSELLCIPTPLVQTQNPSVIRRHILSHVTTQQGIILVGDEIPPFEFFKATGWEDPWAPYKYGHTDLPYGAMDSDFWDNPLRKDQAPLLNKVYFDKDFIYGPHKPTRFSFDLQDFIRGDEITFYQQALWVSRWIAPPLNSKSSLDHFVERREDFRPSKTQNLILTRGAENIMYTPLDFTIRDYYKISTDFWRSLDPANRFAQILMPIDLDASLRFLDPHVNFLILNEHGNPENVGNINYQSFEGIQRLPELVSFDSCLSGAWGYADSLNSSVLTAAFAVPSPPLALIASQGIKSYRTFGEPDRQVRATFLGEWPSGVSLGLHQREMINSELAYWRESLSHDPFYEETVSQVFHSLSIFGDGSFEFARPQNP